MERNSKLGSIRSYLNLKISSEVFLGLALVFTVRISCDTNPQDVAAINNLYVALGNPPLPGWVSTGGDPCADAWQGVQCINSDINSITLNLANLRGELGNNLGLFSSIKVIDLSNNHIGGSIPSSLPLSLQNLFLSDNQFNGSIPRSLSSLSNLSAMSLNKNQLSGELPDAFQSLTVLVNLDLSSNNFSGKLPPSLKNLSSLTTFHLQNNQLSGTLDVLQDLPVRDLNVENNLFSGPIPEKLLKIPIFKKEGNPFNSTISFLPPQISPTLPPSASPHSEAPSSNQTKGNQGDGPSPAAAESRSNSTNKSSKTKNIVLISVSSTLLLIILALGLVLFLPRCCKRRQRADRVSRRHEIAPYIGSRENTNEHGPLVRPSIQIDRDPKLTFMGPNEEHQTWPGRMDLVPKSRYEPELNIKRTSATPKQDNDEIDMSRFDIDLMPPLLLPPPPPPPPQLLSTHVEKVIAKPIVPAELVAGESSKQYMNLSKSYTIASLQLYTNSFSQENLIGEGMLGSVYRAELPDGRFLAVKKLDSRASRQQKDDEFLDLVNDIDRIRHANVVELKGYCADHGQRLLIYEYCSNGNLQDALHSDNEVKEYLSWNLRVRMALGAARALEYLHEVCEPPIIHRNFKSVNVLLDDDLSVHVSDCGLAPLISSGAVSQLSGHLLSAYGYGAPEFESGIYTSKSDVYSYGVVMLELLTGRKSYDRTRSRGEQFLVRWAIPQLHDIDALSRMVDPSLNGMYPAKSLSHFADIISRCVQPEPEFRPPMSEVVQDLIQMIRRESAKRSQGRFT